MFWKRSPKCNHSWHHLQDNFIYVNMGVSVDAEDGCWIFCSKCEREELVYKEEWQRIKRKQEILAVETNRQGGVAIL